MYHSHILKAKMGVKRSDLYLQNAKVLDILENMSVFVIYISALNFFPLDNNNCVWF
jgi:hypothetical protein